MKGYTSEAFHTAFKHFEERLIDNKDDVESWFAAKWQETPPPIYASVDLRNAGFKVAPVDTNLFPAGFNNLSANCLPRSVTAVRHFLSENYPSAQKVMLIPESHTRNFYYLESIKNLQQIFEKAGFDVRIGSLIDDLDAPKDITLNSQRVLTLEPIRRDNDRLVLGDFDADLIVLNQDLSGGHSKQLEHISQPIIPSLSMGWSKRTKSDHFRYYAQVTGEFADWLGFDSWLVSPYFRNCGEINFQTREGEDCLEKQISLTLEEVQKKYDELGLKEAPFVVVKADAGTYGMAVMMVKSAAEIRQLNRKQRNKMSRTKGGQDVSKAIVQEGVYSIEMVGEANAVAEPVVYLVGKDAIGGFYRIHKDKKSDENLNAPGMYFEPFPCPDAAFDASNAQTRLHYVYGVIARLAVLAAARESQQAGGVEWAFG